jgi:hypothetical protein
MTSISSAISGGTKGVLLSGSISVLGSNRLVQGLEVEVGPVAPREPFGVDLVAALHDVHVLPRDPLERGGRAPRVRHGERNSFDQLELDQQVVQEVELSLEVAEDVDGRGHDVDGAAVGPSDVG